jgi:hypothetical protein
MSYTSILSVPEKSVDVLLLEEEEMPPKKDMSLFMVFHTQSISAP